MKKVAIISLVMLTFVGMFLAGSWYGRRTSETVESTGDRKILYYVDPMNPSHTSDKPGSAPCGMAMEPVYADEGMAGEDSVSPGTVKLSSQKQQLLGVRVSQVEVSARTHAFRTIGRVAPDETRVHRLIAGAPGYIVEVSEVTTDDYVEQNQWLGSFSSPDSIPSIQAHILALNTLDNLRRNNSDLSAESLETGSTYLLRAEKLLDLGISRVQLEELRKTRTVPQKIKILSPIDGFVLARNVTPDQKFDRGVEWYSIADLSHVWIVTDVFENEARHVQPGMRARVSIPRMGKAFDAVVTHVPPRFDPVTRALKVRLEMENPGNVLRPDMFVDVEFAVTSPPAVTVSVDAVLDSGTRKTVFVDLGNGRFEPRTVETGWRLGGQVEIVGGLMPGEKIVTSGNFLVDSESRMKLAAAGFYGEVTLDPVCRTDVEVEKASMAGLTREHQGKTYHFCSDICRTEFDKDPTGTIARAARKEPRFQAALSRTSSDTQGRDPNGQSASSPNARSSTAGSESSPAARSTTQEETMNGCVKDHVCGMPMPEGWAKAKGLTSEYNGKTYFFCSKECRSNFEKDPVAYLGSQEKAHLSGTFSGTGGK
ncbi:MAG: efflux RND transporter periplasmic adaptor subunit [Syntrophobacteraceae bacterium]